MPDQTEYPTGQKAILALLDAFPVTSGRIKTHATKRGVGWEVIVTLKGRDEPKTSNLIGQTALHIVTTNAALVEGVSERLDSQCRRQDHVGHIETIWRSRRKGDD